MPIGAASITESSDSVIFSHAYLIGLDDNGGNVKDGESFTLNFSGGGLTGQNDVKINNIACTDVVIASDTVLTATAPTNSLKHAQAYALEATSSADNVASLVVTEANDTISATATVTGSAGNSAITEADDTISATGTQGAISNTTGVGSMQEAADSLAGTVTVTGIAGILSVTEADDVSLGLVSEPLFATGLVIETHDGLSTTGTVRSVSRGWTDELEEDTVWTDVE